MKCPNCGYEPSLSELQRSPDDCVKCGINYQGYQRSLDRQAEGQRSRAAELAVMSPIVRDVVKEYPGAQPVVVVDIKMSFWSMVVFMVKWVLAAIPAMLILALIFGLASSVFVAIPAYFDYRDRATASQSAANPAVMPSRAEPIPVNSDPGSQHEMVDIERAGTNVVITTRRVGKLGEVSYSKRFIDCLNARWKYLGEGSSIAAMNANERASGTFGFAHFESESIAHYIGRRACRGIAQTNHYLQ